MEYQDPEWIAALKTKHPLLFRNIAPYNFNVGPGWQSIVTWVCKALDSLEIPDLTVFQVKQKFGGLRVYTDGEGEDLQPKVMEIIQQAEDRAWHVCEMCGGSAETDGWATLCQTCRAGERKRFTLDAEKWEAFQEALEAHPKPMPRMQKLLTEPGFFDAEIPQGPPRHIDFDLVKSVDLGPIDFEPMNLTLTPSAETLAAMAEVEEGSREVIAGIKAHPTEIPQDPQIRLAPEDQEAFAEGLLNPPPLTPSMLRALERLKAFHTPPSDDPEAQ